MIRTQVDPRYINVDEERAVISAFVVLTSEDAEPARALLLEVAKENIDPDYLFGDDKSRFIFMAAMDFAKFAISPTPENYADWMDKHSVKGMDADRIRNIVEEARGPSGKRIEIGYVLWLLTDRLEGAAKERAARAAIREAEAVITSGNGRIEDRWTEASAILQESMPISSGITAMSGEDAPQFYRDTLQRRAEEKKTGFTPITLPPDWGLGKYVHRLTEGEMTLIVGETGTFKSTLCLDLCLWNVENGWLADKRRGNVFVVYYHAENLQQNVLDRIAVRWLHLPIEEFREGQHQEEVDRAWAERPYMKQFSAVHCPGVRPETIAQDISRRAFALPDEHSMLLAVFDYLDDDKLDLSHIKRQNDAYKIGAAAEIFKQAAERCSRKPKRGYKGGVHMVVAQQLNRELKAYGSDKPKFKSQLQIQVEAKILKETKTFGASGNQFTVKQGMKSPHIRLRIVKANDAEMGYSTLYVRGEWYSVMGIVDDRLFDQVGETYVEEDYEHRF